MVNMLFSSPQFTNYHHLHQMSNHCIYTNGFTQKSKEQFLKEIINRKISKVIDVRNHPRSHFHHFNKQPLTETLSSLDIEYIHLPQLGGVPKDTPTSVKKGIFINLQEKKNLQTILDIQEVAENHNIMICCACYNWKFCHRQVIAHLLAATGSHVVHVSQKDAEEVHPQEWRFTNQFIISQGGIPKGHVVPTGPQTREYKGDEHSVTKPNKLDTSRQMT